jgi:peptide/nickel transport system substrate-binding protein
VSGSSLGSQGALGSSAQVERLIQQVATRQIGRREFIRKALVLGVSLSGASLILEACGLSPASPVSPASNGPSGLTSAAPASAAAVASPKAGGTLRVAMSGDPNGLDPALAGIGYSHLIIEQVYSTLLSLDKDDNPQPDLATAYELSPDGLTYTFHLRPNVTFHNGNALTAEDVKFTFDRLRNPKTGYPFIDKVQTIDHIDVVDPATVRIVLSVPTAPFLVSLAFPGSAIVPKSEVTARGDLSAAPVGSGPFKFVSYQPGTLLTLTRNPTYYEPGQPYLDGLEYHIIQDGTERTNALLGGIVDFSSDVDPKDWQQVSTAPNLAGESISGGHWHWIMLNNTVKPFDNPIVRQAIAYAIDRKAIVDSIFFGQADPIIGGVIPAWSWAYDAAADIFPATADPAKARDLLSQAGFPNGFHAPIVLDASIPPFSSQGPLLQAQLQAAGITTSLTLVPDPKYCNDVFVDHNFTISNQAWLSPLADPDDFITPNYQTNNPNNAQQYSSKKMDGLILEAKSALDQVQRKALYADIEDLANHDVPFVPTLNAHILMARVRGLQRHFDL